MIPPHPTRVPELEKRLRKELPVAEARVGWFVAPSDDVGRGAPAVLSIALADSPELERDAKWIAATETLRRAAGEWLRSRDDVSPGTLLDLQLVRVTPGRSVETLQAERWWWTENGDFDREPPPWMIDVEVENG